MNKLLLSLLVFLVANLAVIPANAQRTTKPKPAASYGNLVFDWKGQHDITFDVFLPSGARWTAIGNRTPPQKTRLAAGSYIIRPVGDNSPLFDETKVSVQAGKDTLLRPALGHVTFNVEDERIGGVIREWRLFRGDKKVLTVLCGATTSKTIGRDVPAGTYRADLVEAKLGQDKVVFQRSFELLAGSGEEDLAFKQTFSSAQSEALRNLAAAFAEANLVNHSNNTVSLNFKVINANPQSFEVISHRPGNNTPVVTYILPLSQLTSEEITISELRSDTPENTDFSIAFRPKKTRIKYKLSDGVIQDSDTIGLPSTGLTTTKKLHKALQDAVSSFNQG